MLACPVIGTLERLLTEQMSDPERWRVEAHIEECIACQETLRCLSQGTPRLVPSRLLSALPDAPQPELTAEEEVVLHRLAETTSSGQAYERVIRPPGPLEPHAPPEVEGYEILEELGRGAMGVVYRARHRELNRLVALKMLLAAPYLAADTRQRFRLEARAIARLHHPNIVQVYDIGEQAGCPYLSLELVEGTTLARRLSGTPQPVAQAARLVVTLARAVEYAHRHGIVHRDLKPANILLQKSEIRNPKSEKGSQASDFGFRISDFGFRISHRRWRTSAWPRKYPDRAWLRRG